MVHLRPISICHKSRNNARGNVHGVEYREKVVRDAWPNTTEVGVILDVEIGNEERIEEPDKDVLYEMAGYHNS